MGVHALIGIVVLLFSLVPSASIQLIARSTAGQGPPARADAELVARTVEIDAVVFGRNGEPIGDLGLEDFEVVENGVVQKLDRVELRGSRVAAAIPASPVSPIESAEDELRAARDPNTRVVALLLDEFHVSPGASTDRVRHALAQFVREELRPQDLLVVMRPLDPVIAIRFTRDREAAHQAIGSFTGRKGDFTPITEFEEKYLGSAPVAVQAGRAQVVVSALRALTMKLGELEAGRAAIVLVSEGFEREARREDDRRVSEIQGIVRAASRFHVAVYAWDPSGARASAGNGATSAEAADPAFATLRTLASQTGGEAVLEGQDDLRSALRRVVRDLDGYYVLTYTSSHQRDGRFYEVQVRAKRRGAQVRTRSGYWAPLKSGLLSARSAAATPARPPRVIRRSRLIETWLGLTVGPDGRQRAIFTWDAAEQTAQPLQPATVAVAARTAEGVPLFEGEVGRAASEPRAGGPAARAVFDAPPGRIQLDLRILGADGAQLDLAGSDVNVPDVSGADPLILPPQVFRTSSAREFNAISADPAAAPSPARVFRRTARLLLRVPTHSSSGAEVELAARVMNSRGQLLRDIPPRSWSSSAGIPQFDLPLSWLAPGEYSIELTATTRANVAKELIRFRVIR